MSIALALHVLSTVIWVGGMFFAHQVLRPVAASQLEPPQRLNLWSQVFARFFPWVWAAIVIILITGYWMIFSRYGSMAGSPLFVHIMHGLGLIMVLIFMHVFFAPYRRLHRYVLAMRWQEGSKSLAQIRLLVGINLTIGLITIVIATAGRYLL